MGRAAELLVEARRRSGLSQRAVAAASGIPQSSVARVERGTITPRTDTLERLLRACGMTLAMAPAPGSGVDRSLIRARLALTPAERHRIGVAEARAMLAFEGARLRRST